ncbi:MAG: dienelactone hydrolase family protein [Lewinella sp.]|nr:dienelactone hydrolase family protein [Lewinella sp.]
MRTFFALIALSLLLTNCGPAPAEEAAADNTETTETAPPESPRHHEWVTLNQNGRELYLWVVYPEVSENVPAVLVIHENRGLNEWAKGFADQVAEAGFIAVAPDLLSNQNPDYPRTSDYPDTDAARDAIYSLDPEQVTADLQLAAEYAKGLASTNGRLVTTGFCWGGSQSFRFATNYDGLSAALVFYGTAPEEAAAFNQINAPVYGFYGGDDNRVNATIEQTDTYMGQAGKEYEYVIYPGAGHAFMRRGEDPEGGLGNIKAREEAFARFKEIMDKL